jgi:TRAP-type C4-dicarboxylate transport system permease large subunit
MYSNYIMLAVPLFILAAEIMNSGTLSDRLLKWCDALVGRFRGGLAQVNVLQSIVFAGMSGSAVADAAGSGKMMQHMMTKDGKYTPSYAAALTAVTAVIGPIIPPSIPMVLYALVADTSIGYLFLGGVVPGLLMAGVMMVQIAITARVKNFPVEEPVPFKKLPRMTWEALPVLFMPVVLMYRAVKAPELYQSVLTSAKTTASIGMLIAGALVFNYVVTVENIPRTISAILLSWDLNPITFLIIVNIILLILGCVLEGTTILLVIVPVLIPTAQALGIDMVHFGVVAVVNIMLGLITPPYGLLLFIMTRISGSPMRAIIGDVMPFLWTLIGALVVFTFVPETVLWLPRMFGYQGVTP